MNSQEFFALRSAQRRQANLVASLRRRYPAIPRESFTAQDTWRFSNGSGETAPAWAVMRATGISEQPSGELLVTIAKADDDPDSVYVFNTGTAVENGETGDLQADAIVRVLSGAASAGAKLAPVDGSWALSANTLLPVQLLAIGPDDAEETVVGLVERGTLARWIAFTLNEPLAEGDGSVEVTVTSYHEGSDPGTTLTVGNALGFEGDTGAAGYALWTGNDDSYAIVQMVCPE